MRNALIIGASGGIGRAVYQRLATSLGAENVTALTRTETGFDLRDPGSISDSLGQLTGSYDLIFLACGILAPQGGKPEKSIKNIDFSSMTELMEVNAIGPALVLKEAERLIPRGRRSVIAALSARVGSIGDNRLGGWYSYRASKAALNQVIRCAAIEFSRNRPQSICVALHPGTVATDFTKAYQSRHDTVPPDHAADNLIRLINGLSADDTGRFFDYAGREIPW